MPSHRSNQKSRQVAGSTPFRVKYLCPHPECKNMQPLSCGSTYARHYRSAHLRQRPWHCTSPHCTFDTTRKTLLQQHWLHAHNVVVVLNKRPRGTLPVVPAPTEVEVDDFDNIIFRRPAKAHRSWFSPQARELSPSHEVALMAGQLVLRAPPGSRRPSLTVETNSAMVFYKAPMVIPSVPPIPSFSAPIASCMAQLDLQEMYDGALPYADYSGSMGSVPYPENTVYNLYIERSSSVPTFSAYGSATAVDSAVPWAAWITPTSMPDKQPYYTNWDMPMTISTMSPDHYTVHSTPLTQASSPSNSPTPFPEVLADQPALDPELESILKDFDGLRTFAHF
ncbi:hypothetical protein DACRYDRAFT_24946 [Dacryopinax primogenitus]|uniref:Uncharacterized protein n=1 Tax=Dacryopinax primogenitus (strain DJM 731) TaxID=1858805 RepID=M5FQ67_DACPD|nr:uncharacterized protein DACRYDRAFT_24946 [Dacryopinax primogenitus]EJT97548.1 hypothetical protein DACRYDRAFT_24946 [Dacryopinax primogenitus]